MRLCPANQEALLTDIQTRLSAARYMDQCHAEVRPGLNACKSGTRSHLLSHNIFPRSSDACPKAEGCSPDTGHLALLALVSDAAFFRHLSGMTGVFSAISMPNSHAFQGSSQKDQL